jgi:hypothetical protein
MAIAVGLNGGWTDPSSDVHLELKRDLSAGHGPPGGIGRLHHERLRKCRANLGFLAVSRNYSESARPTVRKQQSIAAGRGKCEQENGRKAATKQGGAEHRPATDRDTSTVTGDGEALKGLRSHSTGASYGDERTEEASWHHPHEPGYHAVSQTRHQDP